ncbi:hypothetical protein C8Q78DRAFT_260238 [Trametes maxima]|nr:hypothetical protein C8Q78DRAFT_260238 [Trametes maxima]
MVNKLLEVRPTSSAESRRSMVYMRDHRHRQSARGRCFNSERGRTIPAKTIFYGDKHVDLRPLSDERVDALRDVLLLNSALNTGRSPRQAAHQIERACNFIVCQGLQRHKRDDRASTIEVRHLVSVVDVFRPAGSHSLKTGALR